MGAQPGCIPAPSAPPASAVSGTSVPAAEKTSRKDVAGVGLAGAALVGGMAVVGAVIGDEVAESGAMDEVVDTADIAIDDASEWLIDTGEDAGDFIMDLF